MLPHHKTQQLQSRLRKMRLNEQFKGLREVAQEQRDEVWFWTQYQEEAMQEEELEQKVLNEQYELYQQQLNEFQNTMCVQKDTKLTNEPFSQEGSSHSDGK